MSDRDELRDHSFDGIQEYDNDLPRWWLWLLWITVVVSVIYPFVYDFGPGEFASESIDAEMAKVRESQSAHAAAPVAADRAVLLKLTTDAGAIGEGGQIYATRCMPCHGDKGQGLVGPNLTDEYWIHGGSIDDLHRVITEGVLDKGMLAWKGHLTPAQINAVTAFVWSMRGSNPPNPKAPQGDKAAE